MGASFGILASETRTEAFIDGIWYTISRNRMTYNAEGKRTSLENLAGQVTTTAWDGWFVTYNGENRPILWENVSTNSPTHNSSTPTLLSMSYDRMGRRVTKNNQRFVYDGYLQISDNNGNAYVWDPTEPIATRPLVWNYSTSQPFNLLTCHYTHDGNKNVSEIVSHSGGDDTHYEYSPFGRVSAQSGAVADVNPWRFSCEFSDDELDVVYYNYRFYDSMRGTWVRRDPVADIMAASTEAAGALIGTVGEVPICMKAKMALPKFQICSKVHVFVSNVKLS